MQGCRFISFIRVSRLTRTSLAIYLIRALKVGAQAVGGFRHHGRTRRADRRSGIWLEARGKLPGKELRRAFKIQPALHGSNAVDASWCFTKDDFFKWISRSRILIGPSGRPLLSNKTREKGASPSNSSRMPRLNQGTRQQDLSSSCVHPTANDGIYRWGQYYQKEEKIFRR